MESGSGPEILWQRMGDEVVLIHLGTNRIFELNVTAGRLWELLARGHSVEEAVGVLSEEFDADRSRVEEEVTSLAALFRREGFLGADGAPRLAAQREAR